MKIAIAGLGYVGLSNAVLLAQHNEVMAIQGNVVTLKQALYHDYDPALNITVAKYTYLQGAGLENFYMKRTVNGGNDNITMRTAARCWVSGIFSEMTLKS
jgi:UDPglucose 6-dehydrogenase